MPHCRKFITLQFAFAKYNKREEHVLEVILQTKQHITLAQMLPSLLFVPLVWRYSLVSVQDPKIFRVHRLPDSHPILLLRFSNPQLSFQALCQQPDIHSFLWVPIYLPLNVVLVSNEIKYQVCKMRNSVSALSENVCLNLVLQVQHWIGQ